MPIVFAAITPHTPVLLPNAPTDARERLAETMSALQKLEAELYAAKPQIIIIISPHTGIHTQAFTINASPELTSQVAEFGDVETTRSWRGAPELAAQLGHHHNHLSLPVRLISEEQLDYGASIPLLFLTEHNRQTKILPVGFSGLPPIDHLEFGELIKETVLGNGIRAAVIASGDLSHTLSARAPGKFNPKGKEFDQLVRDLLGSKNTVGFATIDPQLVKSADECGYRSILILLGILKNTDAQFETLAYEAPFGVGYLTGIFHF